MSNTERQPLITVVTPIYNSTLFLERTIRSVINQTYTNWELLLIIDQKTTDSSPSIAKKYSKDDPRIKVLSLPECNNLANNRNLGISLAQGVYTCFLDSDDIWLPNKLAVQVNYMIETKTPFTYHSFAVIDESEKVSGPDRSAKYKVGFNDLLKNNCIGCLTVMIESKIAKKYMMEDIRHEDLHYWLKITKDGISAFPIPDVLAKYRVRDNSVSDNKIQSAIWRWNLYKNQNISLIKSIYYLLAYILFAIKKRY